MKLTLTISDPGQAKARSASRTLEKGSLTIGRAASADWVIDDPERLLSKLHCRIENRSDRFVLTDTSTNGVFVNGSSLPVGDGKTTILNDSDRLQLGGATIIVAIDMDSGAGRANQILPDDYSFLEMLGKAYAKSAGAPADFPGSTSATEHWDAPSAGDTVPFQHQAFKPPPVHAPSKPTSDPGGIPDDWLAGPGPVPINGDTAPHMPATAPDNPRGPGSPRGNVERQYRALVTGLASYTAGNASLRAALGCSVGFTNPNSLLVATDMKSVQAALGSGDGAAIAEVLAAGLAHQSALASALRAALERLNGSAALDFKTTLAATYRQVFEAETRRITGRKE